jgi:hypothetical protein
MSYEILKFLQFRLIQPILSFTVLCTGSKIYDDELSLDI